MICKQQITSQQAFNQAISTSWKFHRRIFGSVLWAKIPIFHYFVNNRKLATSLETQELPISSVGKSF